MTTEDRLRSALQSSAALVTVDEDAAWRELVARLEPVVPRSARHPRRREPRVRVAAVVAAVLVVVLGIVGYSLVGGNGDGDRVAVGPPTSAPTPTGAPHTVFDTLTPGATVSTSEWVDAARTLAATRPNMRGTISSRMPGLPQAPIVVTFTASEDGQFATSDSAVSTYVLADGTVVTVLTPSKVVRIRTDASTSLLAPDRVLGQVVRPDQWIQSAAGAGPRIVFDGRGTQTGRETLRFTISFASGAKWTLTLDAATGVALDVAVHDTSAPKSPDREFRIDDLDTQALPLDNGAVSLPTGFTIEAMIGDRIVDGVVGLNATIASVVADVGARAAR